MKSHFNIFGLEEMDSPNRDDEKTGQPLFFRKYPIHFETFEKAHEELVQIQNDKSPFINYKFNSYVILETYSAAKKKELRD